MRTPHIASRPTYYPNRVDSQAVQVAARVAAGRTSLDIPPAIIEQDYTPRVVQQADIVDTYGPGGIEFGIDAVTDQITAYATGAAPAENGFVDRTLSSMAFVDGTRTFTITPTGSTFRVFVQSVAYDLAAASVTLPDAEGLHYIYVDENGALTSTQTFIEEIITLYAFVAAIYWDADNNEAILFAEERHGAQMDSATHSYNHTTFGSRYQNGLSPGDITSDASGNDPAAAQLSISGGAIWDEDLNHVIANGSPQTLGPIAEIPMFYRSGAAGVWRRQAATQYPAAVTGGSIAWNEWTGATWQLTAVSANNYTLTHIFATGDMASPVIGIASQGDYTSLTLAREGAEVEIQQLTFGSIESLSPEFVPVATIIWEHKNAYSNAVGARIRSTTTGDDYIDWRVTRGSGAGGTAGSAPSWGDVVGTLANQLDLQAALDARVPRIAAYVEGSSASAAQTSLPLTIGTDVMSTTTLGVPVSAAMTAESVAVSFTSSSTPSGTWTLRLYKSTPTAAPTEVATFTVETS